MKTPIFRTSLAFAAGAISADLAVEWFGIFALGLDHPQKFGPWGTLILNEEAFGVATIFATLLFISVLAVRTCFGKRVRGRRHYTRWAAVLGAVYGAGSAIFDLTPALPDATLFIFVIVGPVAAAEILYRMITSSK